MNTPFADPAAPILRADPALTDEHRADLHDAFYSKNADELVQHLMPMDIHEDTKQALYSAKKMSEPAPEPLDKTAAAINKIGEIDPKVLDLAETHPNVLKALAASISIAEKATGEPSGASKSSGEGKTAFKGETAPKLVLAPRADGSAHLPPIPANHHRVMASDGGLHDIPAEKIPEAQAIDPNLHVLNP